MKPGQIGGRGPIGRDGATGAEGRAGTTGRDGGDGHTGQQGQQGQQGVQGEQGVRGRSGGRNAAAGFLILMTFAFFGFVAVERQADETIQSLREGCERVNVLRDNQARLIADQVKLASPALRKRGGLGNLEPFRAQIEQQQTDREKSLVRLRDSAAEYPVEGRPYDTNCAAAHP